MMRSDKEIKKEIEKLKGLIGKIRPFTIFGDDNGKQLEAQIKVLEEKMDIDDVYDDIEFCEDEMLCCDLTHVVQWMNNEEGEPAPSKGWKDLVIKK